MLVVLFGLAGAGKTYVGKLLSENSDFHFCESKGSESIDFSFTYAKSIDSDPIDFLRPNGGSIIRGDASNPDSLEAFTTV